MSVEDRLDRLEANTSRILNILEREKLGPRVTEKIHTIELHACEYDNSLKDLIRMLEIPDDIIKQHIQATTEDENSCKTYEQVSELGIMVYRIENTVQKYAAYFMGNAYDRCKVKCIIQKK